MELDPEQWLVHVLERRHRRVIARRRDAVARRWSIDVVAMTHPDRRLLSLSERLEQPATLNPHLRATVFAAIRTNDLAAREMREQLHPIAETEDRNSGLEQGGLGGRHVFVIDRVRAAGQDDALGLPFADPAHRSRRRMDFAVHVRLSHPPGDELGVLRPEVDDEDASGWSVTRPPALRERRARPGTGRRSFRATGQPTSDLGPR